MQSTSYSEIDRSPTWLLSAEIFLAKVKRKNGKLRHLRDELEIWEESKIEMSILSRNHYLGSALTYKIEERDKTGCRKLRGSWVVKFSPPYNTNPWYDVKREYKILKFLQDKIPTPKPLYCSNTGDEKILNGAAFIIMEFIPGISPECIRDIPSSKIKTVCLSVMRVAAKLHEIEWPTKDCFDFDSFWKEQVQTWGNNYNTTVQGVRSQTTPSTPVAGHTVTLFRNKLMSTTPPKKGEPKCSVIHGSLDPSNVILDDNYEVKAIVDWKYATNGDPNVDLAYFFVMFLEPPHSLRSLRLLVGNFKDCPTEETVLKVYKMCRRDSCSSFRFYQAPFKYARAVCCLRLISVLEAAQQDKSGYHECRMYIQPHLMGQALQFLANAGEMFLPDAQ
jgi:aminoglycoside phosphotransferase (APT) family kinase protein